MAWSIRRRLHGFSGNIQGWTAASNGSNWCPAQIDIAGIGRECRNRCSASKQPSLPTVTSVGCRNGIRARDRALVDVAWSELPLGLHTENKKWETLSALAILRNFSAGSSPSSLANRITFVRVGSREDSFRSIFTDRQSTEDISVGVFRRLAVLDGVVELSKK